MESTRPKRSKKIVAIVVVFLIALNVTLGYLLASEAASSIVSLMHTRMLDASNTAAAMIDGDVLKTVSPADEGTEGYESIMRTLTYFQDNIDLRYIYCIRDMGDGTFTFGLDPTVEDPGEFGSPIVYTDALYKASQGTPCADDEHYEDAWGAFYSAYSPVLDSAGKVAGIIAVDFDAAWYDQQLAILTFTTCVVAVISLLAGCGIMMVVLRQSERRMGKIHGQLSDLQSTLMEEMGTLPRPVTGDAQSPDAHERGDSIDELEWQIQSMQTELKTQAAQMHGAAYRDGLTGVKSKYAYLETQKDLDERLATGELSEFAVVVCDVNGLKKINDTLGHQAGDEYIRAACRMICDIFSHSPVFRVGGDEFCAILTGRDFNDRRVLMHELHRQSSFHISTGEAVVSGGLSDYAAGQDTSVQEVFKRADAAMYEEKALLKSLGAATRDDTEDAQAQAANLGDISLVKSRRALLIADDVEGNREILGDLLEEDYDIYYAADGVETMNMLELHKDEIALLLLDLYMPNMTGREVMEKMQVDEDLMSIPVIVLTIDNEAELDSLRIGAMDFISKPYPDIEIIKARISQCIELSESREVIRYTQWDKLTGLYNLDYFVRYVDLLDQQHKDASVDAVAIEVIHFHELAEQNGRQFVNLVVRNVGAGVKRLARRTGGVGCREGDGTFLMYCPHQENLDYLLARFVDDLFLDEETKNKVRLKIGVFAHAEAEPIAEERFNYAKLAADDAEDDPERLYGVYGMR